MAKKKKKKKTNSKNSYKKNTAKPVSTTEPITTDEAQTPEGAEEPTLTEKTAKPEKQAKSEGPAQSEELTESEKTTDPEEPENSEDVEESAKSETNATSETDAKPEKPSDTKKDDRKQRLIIGSLAIFFVILGAAIAIYLTAGIDHRKSSVSKVDSSSGTDARTDAASREASETEPRTEGKDLFADKPDETGSGKWVEVAGGERQFEEIDGTIRKNALFRYDGDAYYVDVTGKMVRGTFTVAGRLRLFDDEGKLVETEGWSQQGSARYYVDENISALAGGTYKIDEKQYYFDKEGALQTGWIDLGDGKYYYTDAEGAILCDQDFTEKDVWYHAEPDGTVFLGTQYEKAQEYRSDTKYLILANLSTQRTSVFEGSQGKWKLLREMIVSSGLRINPTPKGEFRTLSHTLHFDNYGVRAWYATAFIGGLYLFHSSPYEIDSEPKVCTDPRLGYPTSHGCIRMALEDAKWMHDNLPLGTKVVIYENE